jgi:dihydrofolate reductase
VPSGHPCPHRRLTVEGKAPALAMIWAMAENRVIGAEGGLPWRLPGELAYFRAMTLGKPVIMGRKTYASLRKPLPGRTNIVITRDPEFTAPERVWVVGSVEEALARGRDKAREDGVAEVMVIGGATIYEACLPLADRLYLTEIHGTPEGDTFFPPLPSGVFEERRRLRPPRESDDSFPYSLVYLTRRSPAA